MALVDRQLHPGWHKHAACNGQTGLMYSTLELEKAAARRVCRGCGVREACLASALLHDEPDGIWGGFDYVQRRALMRRMSENIS